MLVQLGLRAVHEDPPCLAGNLLARRHRPAEKDDGSSCSHGFGLNRNGYGPICGCKTPKSSHLRHSIRLRLF